jgi:predicted Zn-dependent protease
MYVTDEPLCEDNPSDLISGHARINCDGSVVSTYEMFKNNHYNRNSLVHTALHELGHNFGLKHCDNSTCLMVAKGLKNSALCDACKNKVK